MERAGLYELSKEGTARASYRWTAESPHGWGTRERSSMRNLRDQGAEIRSKSKMGFKVGPSEVIQGIHCENQSPQAICCCWRKQASHFTDPGLGWPGTSKDEK